MIKINLSIVAFFSLAIVHAQNAPKDSTVGNHTFYQYNYDFSSPATMMYKMVKYRKDRVHLSVQNVNRLIYDIAGSAQMVNIDLSFAKYFDSLSNNINSASITPIAKAGAATGAFDPGAEKKKFIGTHFQADIDNVIDLQSKIQDKFDNGLTDNLKNLEYFSNFAKIVPSIITGERHSQSIILSRMLSENSIQKLNKGGPFADFNSLYSTISSKPTSLANAIKISAESIKSLKKQADEIISRIKSQCNTRTVTNITDADCDLKDLELNFPPHLDEALAQADKIDEVALSNSISTLLNLLNQVNDRTNFSYLSQEFIPDGDYMNVKALFTPKDAYKNLYQPDSITLQIPIKGKFEWSIGPAVNFSLTKSLFDNSYNIDSSRNTTGTVKTDTFTIKKNKNQNNAIPSIGIMANFYWQKHTAVTPGISVGLSTSTTDLSQLRVYLGGSLFIGGLATNNNNLIYNHLILSAGVAYGQVDRLKGNLNIGENPKSQIPYTGNNIATDELTEKVGKFGLYVGICYKLN
jgi:hypothetical protein